MIPVMQTTFGVDPTTVADPSELGNCLQASVASILGVALDEVPHFVAVPGDNGEWWDAMRNWAREMGRDFVFVASLRDVQDWGDCFHAIATGRSPRGPWNHCVVVDRWGDLVHDPHPAGGGRGLLTTAGYYLLCLPYDS